ncbi:NRAMP (natural resistance-associated macrophage protein)-like metal ion transporter [Trinickia symbiotica]|uniref:NRAMP family metal ion transporter n=1 Tax=Trinickia symbiotica TaxID=863227 RepID=A0A2N7X7M0_9BURK|nr:divalent metal cation transporter [Trinickia symbiotica]PMS37759.1 NRAMP family metal ion transporter [Trinickia symbiotica]PPK44306.1 NRAMP (natural resistance-associated macrophage protein)-like metal ion transporter [Trinickia symbiotica]
MADFQALMRRSGDALRATAGWGPGLLVMLADCDAGNVVTAAQSGARWGVRLLPVLLALIPLLYMIQELCVRLGIFNGRGFGELVRRRFGALWAGLAAAGLFVAVMGSLVTEFTGVAGVGEMYGVPRYVTLPLAVCVLLAVVATGSHKRVDRVAMLIGMFELSFFAVVWHARPDFSTLARQLQDMPFRHAEFSYLAAALIGATFNPWMIFYQQAAVADKKFTSLDYHNARVETALGSVLTQLLTGAVLVATAATLSNAGDPHGLQSVGEIGAALSSVVGPEAGRLLFGAGVLGASLVAAIVCSLALAWGIGEVSGYSRSLEGGPTRAPWFFGVYAGAVGVSALIVGIEPDLVSLNVGAQVLNALMLPLIVGLLIALAAVALPVAHRPSRWYLGLVGALAAIVCVAGFAGAAAGWLL